MITTKRYVEQVQTWPECGRHILAQHDDESVIVYQAYGPAIGTHAVRHGEFGGEFSYSRMSWIKPNFLWMMYRSGWATKPGQETVLGLRTTRRLFDEILGQAVNPSYDERHYPAHEEWRVVVQRSSVRLQWDSDHDPAGTKVARRAVQLGLRGPVLESFGKRELLEVIDMTDLVASQRSNAPALGFRELVTSAERVYLPADDALRQHLGLDTPGMTGEDERAGS